MVLVFRAGTGDLCLCSTTIACYGF